MSRHASGTAFIGLISGKPDIGDAVAGAASQTAHSGGTGQPSGPTRGLPFEGWTRRRTEGRRKPPG